MVGKSNEISSLPIPSKGSSRSSWILSSEVNTRPYIMDSPKPNIAEFESAINAKKGAKTIGKTFKKTFEYARSELGVR